MIQEEKKEKSGKKINKRGICLLFFSVFLFVLFSFLLSFVSFYPPDRFIPAEGWEGVGSQPLPETVADVFVLWLYIYIYLSLTGKNMLGKVRAMIVSDGS